MKTLVMTIAMMSLAVSYSHASEGLKVKKNTSTQAKKEILTAEQETQFMNGQLSEMVVKPIYTETEQFIFTQQVKKIKKKN